MAVDVSTGTLFAVVAGEPATHDDAGFAALTWVPVGEVTDLPEYGPDVTVVTHEPLETGITEKHKGFINYGSLAVGLGRDSADAGQAVLSEATVGATKNDEHSFRVTFPNGSIHYYTGKVFSYTTNAGSANSIVSSTANVEINSTIVEVAA